MTRVRGFALMASLLLALGLTACRGGGATDIKTLLDDPARFDQQTVRVAGTVDQSAAVLGYGTYQVDDGTGTLWVVSQGGGAPRNGARVGVEGEFRSAFTLGDRTGAVLMESKRYTP